MMVQLKPEQEQRLAQIALRQNRMADELAHEALDRYLDYRESLAEAVCEGDKSGERNGWIPHEEVFTRLNERLLKTA